MNPLGGKKTKPMGSRKQSIARRVGRKIGNAVGKVKSGISNSFIGKAYRSVKKMLKFAWGVVKKVGRAIKKTVKAIYKTVKFAAKAFVKTSMLLGRGVKVAAKAVVSGVKKVYKLAKSGKLLTSIIAFAPAKIVTKIGWKAIKFVGKKIWAGIKKLAFKAMSVIGRLFGMMGKFVNKVSTWISIIGKGIVDKAYRSIVQPIASILVSVFGFTLSVVMAPVNFMKWLVSSVIDRIS